MNDRLLGMYIHMHWSYNYPYAARTWSVEDWSAYLSGLKGLGYNLVQIWPMIDTMPVQLTKSDHAHLDKVRQVIDIIHEYGMTVYVGASANTIGNERAADYEFNDRPYFVAERRINPGDKQEVMELMKARKMFLEPLAQADGFWIIDNDPGGYAGSSPCEFMKLFEKHRHVLDDLRPGIKLLYWMWAGWRDRPDFRERWKDNPQTCWCDVLEGIMALNPEPWGLLACCRGHFAVVKALGLASRTLYFPYSTIECEPSFPWTNHNPEQIVNAFEEIPPKMFPLGVMGNAQSHCLQLPHTYLFRHIACGGTKGVTRLQEFAEDVLPGFGDGLAKAWTAMGVEDIGALESAATVLARIPFEATQSQGRFSGLCFGKVDRLVHDLKAQIDVKIALLRMKEQIDRGANLNGTLKNVVQSLQTWWKRHGFADRYYGPFKDLLHPILRETAEQIQRGDQLSRALDAFDAGSQHGAFARLLEVLKTVE